MTETRKIAAILVSDVVGIRRLADADRRSILVMSTRWSVRRGSTPPWAGLLTDDLATRLAAAEATVTKALSLAPNNALAHFAMGTVPVQTKRATQGIAEANGRWR
jgi:hypothetical protein